MFEVQKPSQKSTVVIRAATGNELSNYEKRKLAAIEENAQENKIEAISINIDGDKLPIAPVNKEVEIGLGNLALKSRVAPTDIAASDVFIIECALEDEILNERN